MKDKITGARAYVWDASNDAIHLHDIPFDTFINNHIDWDKGNIELDDPERNYGKYYEISNVEVYQESLDEWLEAHRNRHPSANSNGTDVVSKEAIATKPTSAKRRGGGPKPRPYLPYLERFLEFRLNKKGRRYFSENSISAIAKEARIYFQRDEIKGKELGVPKRSGFQDQIKIWIGKNVPLD